MGVARLPDNLDLSIWQGDAQHFTIKMQTDGGVPIPVEGYIPEAVIRKTFNDPVLYRFTCTVESTNEIRLYMPTSITEDIPAGDYVWSFSLSDTRGDSRTYIAGDVKVYAQVDGL